MVVDVSESQATEAGFELRLKNYRILEGSGVTFHCKMTGYPLPKVCITYSRLYSFYIFPQVDQIAFQFTQGPFLHLYDCNRQQQFTKTIH